MGILNGACILNTRPYHQARELTRCLEAEGAEVVSFPCLAIEMGDVERFRELLGELTAEDWVVFTSANGVYALEGLLSGLQARVAVIGERTAEAVSQSGLAVSFCAEESSSLGLARGLLEYFESLGEANDRGRVVLLRGERASTVLPDTLRRAGVRVEAHTTYRSVKPRYSAKECALIRQMLLKGAHDRAEIDAITFTSMLAVEHFVQHMTEGAQEIEPLLRIAFMNTPVACIGPQTADTARSHGFEIIATAQRTHIHALVDALGDLLSQSVL